MIHAMVGCTTSVNPFAGKREGKWEEIEGVEGKFVLSWDFPKKLYRILSDYIHFASTKAMFSSQKKFCSIRHIEYSDTYIEHYM